MHGSTSDRKKYDGKEKISRIEKLTENIKE
jgi:hypothetical protein